MKRLLLFLACLVAVPVAAQTVPYTGFCTQGGVSSITQGLGSTNKLEGIVPSCTVTVYLHNTLTLATLSTKTRSTLHSPIPSRPTHREQSRPDNGSSGLQEQPTMWF